MNVDAIRPAPLLPPGSLLEDGEHTLLPVSLQSFFPYLVCVELDNSLGFGRKISLNTQWKLKHNIVNQLNSDIKIIKERKVSRKHEIFESN